MSDESTATVAGDAVSYPLPTDAPAEMSVSDAARMLSQARRAKENPPAESAAEATAEPLAEQAEADLPQEDPGEVETQADEPEEQLPPIDPPRSWTKEEKEVFAQWPREAQESIARVASTREAEFRRSQNEAAEAKKALEAQMAQAEQVRKDYEAKLPTLAKTIETALQQEFGDIQTIADVRKMQAEDPFRFQAWQLRQMELAAAQKEAQEAEQRQTQEKQSKWTAYTDAQDKKFTESLTEADKLKIKDLMNEAPDFLEARGFGKEELANLWHGNELFRDHRVQSLILDAMKYRDIQKAPVKAVPKPVPPVQRPGIARGGSASISAQIQNLESQLNHASGKNALLLAAQLTALKRTAASR